MSLTNPNIIIDTTFSSKNISSAASVYQYTAAASGWHLFSVKLTNAAGNGDYIIYLKRQWGGTGTASVVLPKTTGPAASGETVIEFMTLLLFIKINDVVDIMIDGLAGDTAVNGNVQIAALNFSVLEASDTNATVAISATEAETLANDNVAVSQAYKVDVAITSTVTDDLSTATKLWFAIKRDSTYDDSRSVIFVEQTAGLTYLNEAAYGTAAHGDIVVTGSSGAWTVTVTVEEEATAQLVYFGTYSMELKALVSGKPVYISGGNAVISRRVVQSIA